MTHIVTNHKPESVDHNRFERFKAGCWTVEELAALEGVQVQTVQASIDRAIRREHMLLHFRIMELRQQGQLANEEFRDGIRERYADKVAAALGKLLDGQKAKVTVDEGTGKVTIEHVVEDPETMAAGVMEYRKFALLEEKPAVAPTVQVQNHVVRERGL